MSIRNLHGQYGSDFQLLLPAFIALLMAGIFGICVDSGIIINGQPIKSAIPLPESSIDLDHFPFAAPGEGYIFFGDDHG